MVYSENSFLCYVQFSQLQSLNVHARVRDWQGLCHLCVLFPTHSWAASPRLPAVRCPMTLNSRSWNVRRDMPISRPSAHVTSTRGSPRPSRFCLFDTDQHRIFGGHMFKMMEPQCWNKHWNLFLQQISISSNLNLLYVKGPSAAKQDLDSKGILTFHEWIFRAFWNSWWNKRRSHSIPFNCD